MELEVYKKSDFYEDYISSQKEYYERENADAYFAEKLAEKDKAIADKDKEIVELKKQVHDYAIGLFVIQANAEKEVRHHKYKRCLKNREICVMRFDIELTRQYPTRCAFWSKWEHKWLELAEQFKEAK